MPTSKASHSKPWMARMVVAALLASGGLVAALGLANTFRSHSVNPPQTTQGLAASPGDVAPGTPASRVRLTRALAADPASSGSHLVIPALSVNAPLSPTGAIGRPGAAALTIPPDIHDVGWWDGAVTDGAPTVRERAPEPGQPGVAIVAGHIDSAAAGPGALYHLADLQVGDTINVVNLNGRSSAWTVYAPPETVSKKALPAGLFATTGPARLAVVSCGGPFDYATGHYLDNIIVWAVQQGSPRPGPAGGI